ncbi:tRNA pseudouridine(55) synthase TruB [Tautonia marina]|uniref:tRNA pseudouridine(55) synthase TruB n=1 Tax=Tautonia marina TaxID=2653855 RepID=UPI001F179F54|nr:tRNA pseudouridine(55) synthase TruB [Tautonia marina]
MPPSAVPLSGFLNVDKPIGLTSRDVVNRVVRAFRKPKPKVGHAGTLDPLASGVLVVAIGSATRLIEQVQRQPKTYLATILLGATSDTLDADGTITPVLDPPIPSEAQVRDALASQVGTIDQLPPAYSALRVDGKRAYDLAREGKSVELAPRPVRIDQISLLRYEWPHLEISVDCGAGTYIRSIARDVGDALGCGGLIATLRRTRIGPFLEDDAISADPEFLTFEAIVGRLRSPLDAVTDRPHLLLNAEQAAAIGRGQAIEATAFDLTAPSVGEEVALLAPDGSLLALAKADPTSGLIQPRRVFASSSTPSSRSSNST